MDVGELILAILPTLICSCLVLYITTRQNKHDKKVLARAEARQRESLLALEMQMATAKLAYALAMAVKRGAPNGEVEEGVQAYESAKAKYFAFLNEEAFEHIREE